MEGCCCCDYTPAPDTAPCPEELDVPKIIEGLDALINTGRDREAADYLDVWLEKAREAGDWRAELSIISEQLGLCRKTGDSALAFESAESAKRLIREHNMGETVSGATVLLNAATTLKCFGRADESMPLFRHTARVFANNLDPHDYRMAGLYNNMALSYVDIGGYEEAEKYFRLALTIVGGTDKPDNDAAVTWCNIAELYARQDSEDRRIEECMDKAYEALCAPGLAHDGYHAYTISKCLPCFDKFGFFLYSRKLRERMEKIRASI